MKKGITQTLKPVYSEFERSLNAETLKGNVVSERLASFACLSRKLSLPEVN
jgi:hypothetical protein